MQPDETHFFVRWLTTRGPGCVARGATRVPDAAPAWLRSCSSTEVARCYSNRLGIFDAGPLSRGDKYVLGLPSSLNLMPKLCSPSTAERRENLATHAFLVNALATYLIYEIGYWPASEAGILFLMKSCSLCGHALEEERGAADPRELVAESLFSVVTDAILLYTYASALTRREGERFARLEAFLRECDQHQEGLRLLWEVLSLPVGNPLERCARSDVLKNWPPRRADGTRREERKRGRGCEILYRVLRTRDRSTPSAPSRGFQWIPSSRWHRFVVDGVCHHSELQEVTEHALEHLIAKWFAKWVFGTRVTDALNAAKAVMGMSGGRNCDSEGPA